MVLQTWLVLTTVMGAVVSLAVIERIINALVSSMWFMTIGFGKGEAKFEFAALQLVTYTASSGMRVVVSVVNVIVYAISGIMTWLLLAFMILLGTGLLYMAYEQYPVVARGVSLQWNDGIGPTLHFLFILPIKAANMFFGAVLPLYNTVVWVSVRLVSEGFVMPLVRGWDDMLRVFTSASGLVRTSSQSLTAYSLSTVRNCAGPEGGVVSTQCLGDVGIRTLDLITPLTHFRDIVAILVGWVATEVCSALAVPLDIMTVPIMDINFIKGVHNIVNAALWTVVQIPVVTEARCRLFRETDGVVMCLPDFEPTFR